MKKKLQTILPEIAKQLVVLGIASHQNHYKLSWALNQSLGLQLSEATHVEIVRKALVLTFSRYSDATENDALLYRLVANRSEDGVLVSKYKNVDFLLLLFGTVSESEKSKLLDRIKLSETVLTVFEMENKWVANYIQNIL